MGPLKKDKCDNIMLNDRNIFPSVVLAWELYF
jgi:hypothetical protein